MTPPVVWDTDDVLTTALGHAEKHGAQKVLSVTLEVGGTRDLIEFLVKNMLDSL